MLRRFGTRALALCAIAVFVTTCYALRAVPVRPVQMPAPYQVAQSDVILIGKVESLADKTVSAKHYLPGADGKLDYQVATVKIQDGLLGTKGLTHVQVAFVPGNPNTPPIRGGGFQISLAKDQEACFFLTKHPTESFYVAVNYYDIVNKTSADFDKYSALAKKCAKALDDPEKGLKSKEASDRLLAANMLLTKYRQPKFGGNKQEAIDADESKRILEAMAEADWTKTDAETSVNALGMFYQLGINQQDGWTPPKDPNQLVEAAKKWIKENSGSYKIKRLVLEKTEK